MLLSILDAVLCLLGDLVLIRCRHARTRDTGLLARRHEVRVLRRRVKRTEDEDRSLYEQESLTIIINLDHPVVAAALGEGGVDNITFRRLSYEIAFSEYAVALGYQMASFDSEIPADDLLYEVRRTLNRVARSAAALYSN